MAPKILLTEEQFDNFVSQLNQFTIKRGNFTVEMTHAGLEIFSTDPDTIDGVILYDDGETITGA